MDRAASQRKEKRGALLDHALGPGVASMPPDDPLHRRQSDSAAWILSGGMKPLKRPEQSICVSLVESRAVVANKKCSAAVHAHLAKNDPDRLTVRGALCAQIAPG